MPKNNWQPSASLQNLQLRARILQQIRAFFSARHVLEIETPLLCSHSVTAPYIQSIPALVTTTTSLPPQIYYLQTSPEYAMKRVLAAYGVPIYQLTKAFRQDEVGRFHNSEFTLLEWYQPHFNHHQLMDEMDELLQLILKIPNAIRKTYAELFMEILQIDPHQTEWQTLKSCADKNAIDIHGDITDKDTWLDILMTHCIEPHLQGERAYFIYDYPSSQAALARIHNDRALRFEVYMRGIELANGFYELQDAAEQERRFKENNKQRQQLGFTEMSVDHYLLNALAHGLPDCAGVALGVDRLLMLAASSDHIADILSFDFSRV